MKRDMKICIVSPPNFGYRQHELMNDIALSVGATYFSEKTGDDLSLMEFSDLGHAEKIIAGSDSSIILKDNTKEVDKRIVDRVNQLRDLIKITTKQADIDFTLSRIASLTGGIGVLYAGGNTDLEQKELFDRIDDAVLLTGVVAGDGEYEAPFLHDR